MSSWFKSTPDKYFLLCDASSTWSASLECFTLWKQHTSSPLQLVINHAAANHETGTDKHGNTQTERDNQRGIDTRIQADTETMSGPYFFILEICEPLK